MKLEEILSEFSKKEGIENLTLDSFGKCKLIIDDRLLIVFEKSLEEEGFYLYSIVTEVPLSREKEITIMALEGNLFGKETGSANLGLHSDSRSLILFDYFQESETNYSVFDGRYSSFLQHLVYWKRKTENEHPPELQDICLEKHVFDLKDYQDMKIFFA